MRWSTARGKEGSEIIPTDLDAQRGRPRPEESDQVCSFTRGDEPGLSHLA